MVATWALAYLGAWLVGSTITFVTARHLGGRGLPMFQTFGLSVLAGAIWPLMVLGAIEISSVAVWSAALCRTSPEPPDEWMTMSPEGVLTLR